MKWFWRFYNYLFSREKDFVRQIHAITGIPPANVAPYRLAFKHRSLFPALEENNERLELLGDAALDLILTEYLYVKYPFKDEGFITKMRAKVVSRKTLNYLGEKLGLVKLMQYNQSSIDIRDRRQSLIGNTLEAFIGAMFIDLGYERTSMFVKSKIIDRYLDWSRLEKEDEDYKSRLIELAQKRGFKVEYRLIQEETLKGRSRFIYKVFINGKASGTGEGMSKKEAQQKASMEALKKIDG